VLLLATHWPALLDMIAFAGPWYLFAYTLISYLDPRRKLASAANDNLPEKRNLRILGHLTRQAILSPRYVLALFAVLIQVWEPSLPALPQFLTMEVACAVVVATAVSLQAILAKRLLGRIRPLAHNKTASHKARKVFIARRAVTAGYRRIAA
jgi:threonine/homoserine/homoserine lactone efflux protein